MVAKIIASIIKETNTVEPLKPRALNVPISTNLVETALYIVLRAANIAPTAIISGFAVGNVRIEQDNFTISENASTIFCFVTNKRARLRHQRPRLLDAVRPRKSSDAEVTELVVVKRVLNGRQVAPEERMPGGRVN